MTQIGLAGVSAVLPFVTGPTPAEGPSRRVQDQQSSRPVRETDEADDGGDVMRLTIFCKSKLIL